MEPLLEIAAAMVGAGFGRSRRRPRPVSRVYGTPWLAVGLAATVANAAVLLIASWYVVRFGMVLMQDELLFFLALMLLPVVLMGIGAALGLVGWMVGVIRKLLARDASARLDLAVVGTAGVLVVGSLVSSLGELLLVPLLIPSFASVVVSIAPDAWRPVERTWSTSPV